MKPITQLLTSAIPPCPLRSVLRLHLLAHALDFTKDAEQVAAQDLLDLLRRETAVEQRLRDLGQIGGGVDAQRGRTDAVEVGAEPHMVNARDLGDVVDLINEGL